MTFLETLTVPFVLLCFCRKLSGQLTASSSKLEES